MTGWSAFDIPVAPDAATPSELERAAAAVHASPSGRLLLDHLAQRTLSRALPPSASDAELRHLEGQRALIHDIKILIERGNQP